MHKLSCCISAVLGSGFQNPNSSQYHNFQFALKCVSAVVDFSLMAQYRSHTLDTLSYMEWYLTIVHWTKDIFPEFRTWKATQTEANRPDRELRELIANMLKRSIRILPPNTISKRIRIGFKGLISGQI